MSSFHNWLHGFRTSQGLSKEENLRKIYSKQNTLPPLIEDPSSNPLKIKDYYVNLQIKHKEPTPIQLTELYSDSFPSTRILIKGEAGIGKTTLMHYISYQWSQKNLFNQFKYVFRLKLRNLTHSNWKGDYDPRDQKEHLLSCFVHYCLGNTNRGLLTLEHIKRITEKSADKTILLLDGYDEVAHLANEPNGDLSKIKEALFASYPNIIMTLRPNSMDANLQEQFPLHLEAIGLDDAGIKLYTENRFTEGQGVLGHELWQFLEKNPHIKEICHIPIHLDLICQLWALPELKDKLNNHTSIGALYSHIVVWMGKRHLANFYKKDTSAMLDEEVLSHPCISLLKELGYKASCFGPTTIDTRLLQQSLRTYGTEITRDLPETEKRLSPIQAVYKMGILRSMGNGQNIASENLEFIHATFQEYMGALYLKDELISQNPHKTHTALDFISNPPNETRCPMVLRFLASLLSYDQSPAAESSIQLFWEAFTLSSTNSFKIAGKRELGFSLQLLAQMMHKGTLDARVPPSIVLHIDNIVTQDIFSWETELKESRYSSPPIIDCLSNELNNSLGDKSKTLQSIKILSSLQLTPLKQEEIARKILEKLSDPDPEIILTAVYALQGFNQFSFVKQALLQKTESLHKPVAFAAMEVLGKLGDNESIQRILEQLQSSDTATVIGAINALAFIGKCKFDYIMRKLLYKLGDNSPDRLYIARKALETMQAIESDQPCSLEHMIYVFTNAIDGFAFDDVFISASALSNLANDNEKAITAVLHAIANCSSHPDWNLKNLCELIKIYGMRMQEHPNVFDSTSPCVLSIRLLFNMQNADRSNFEEALIIKTVKEFVQFLPDYDALAALHEFVVFHPDFHDLKPIQEIIRELCYKIPPEFAVTALDLLFGCKDIHNHILNIKLLTAISVLRLKIPEGTSYPLKAKLAARFNEASLKKEAQKKGWNFDWPQDGDSLPRHAITQPAVAPFSNAAALKQWLQELNHINMTVRELALFNIKNSECSNALLLECLEEIFPLCKGQEFTSIIKTLQQAFTHRKILSAELESRLQTKPDVAIETTDPLDLKIRNFLQNPLEEDSLLRVLAKDIANNKTDIKLSKIAIESETRYILTVDNQRQELQELPAIIVEQMRKLTKAVCAEYANQESPSPIHYQEPEIFSLTCESQPLDLKSWHISIIEPIHIVIAEKKTLFGDFLIEKIDLHNKTRVAYVKSPQEITPQFLSTLWGKPTQENKGTLQIHSIVQVDDGAKKQLLHNLSTEGIKATLPLVISAYGNFYHFIEKSYRELIEGTFTKKDFSSLQNDIHQIKSKVTTLEQNQQIIIDNIIQRIELSVQTTGEIPLSFTPYQKQLYNVLRAQLTAVYTAAQAVQTDIVTNSKTGILGNVSSALNTIGNAIPVIGTGVQILSSILSYVDSQRQAAQVEHYAKLAANPVEMATLADKVAKEIALSSFDVAKLTNPTNFIDQCLHMLEESIEKAQATDLGKILIKLVTGFSYKEASLELKEGESHALIISSILISKIFMGKDLEDYDMENNANSLIAFFKKEYCLSKPACPDENPLAKTTLIASACIPKGTPPSSPLYPKTSKQPSPSSISELGTSPLKPPGSGPMKI